MKGIFLNIDINSVTFPFLQRICSSSSPKQEDFYPFVDQYANTQVTDIAFNIFCQISMTPSEVWSDALDSYYRTEENGVSVDYKAILSHYQQLYEVYHIDPHEVWLNRCREKGLRAWLSVRMNDCHCPDEKAVWIRGKEFYEADAEGWKIGAAFGYQRHCYNYAQPKIREKMLAYIREQLLRYDADGLELDFSREWYCFPEGIDHPEHIMTAFFQEIKSAVREAEIRWKHKIDIHLRVMRDIAQNLALGFDVAALWEGGLIDSLSIAPRWASNDSDIPLSLWRERFPSLPIYAGITDLTLLKPTPYEAAAGYAAAYLATGADKIYLYNYFSDPDAEDAETRKAHRTCGALETLMGVPRRFIVTLQDVMPLGVAPWRPFPRPADGLSLPVTLCPAQKGEAVTLIIGTERRICADDLAVRVNGHLALPLGETEEGASFAEGACRFFDKSDPLYLYAYRLPTDVLTDTQAHLSVETTIGDLSVFYAEFIFGRIPLTKGETS